MESLENSEQVQDEAGSEVMQDLGMSDGDDSSESDKGEGSHASLSVQKRLKAQKRAHERTVRELHSRIGELEQRFAQPNDGGYSDMNNPNGNGNPMSQGMPQGMPGQQQMPQGMGQGQGNNGNIDDSIQKAVAYALQHREMQEGKQRQDAEARTLYREYQDFNKHLEGMNDKYDDFHETVVGNDDAPFTATMRDYALTLPRSGPGSGGEVLYKLGKNPDELARIARLPVVKQSSELAKLSHALMKASEDKSSNSSNRPLGTIKSNPVSSSGSVTEKTPIGSIRARMKSGSWK